MHFGVVLHGEEQMIERFLWGPLRQRGECLLRFAHVFAAHGLAQQFAARAPGRQRHWFDRMEHLIFAPAAFLDSVCVSVKHFEHRQRLQLGGELLGHVQRGGQRHHGMKPDVVLTAKGAGVGQGGGRG